uniref:Catalytic n=1 Tax=Rhizophora mucronata TaxID=61149 RepID=A0A2P2MDU8_RHIMU
MLLLSFLQLFFSMVQQIIPFQLMPVRILLKLSRGLGLELNQFCMKGKLIQICFSRIQ